MSTQPNRVGRGEALKRLFEDRNGLGKNAESKLVNPETISGGRGSLFKSPSQASPCNGASSAITNDYGNAYTNGSGTSERNGTHTLAGAGRAKLFQCKSSDENGHRMSGETATSKASSRTGSQEPLEKQLSSLDLEGGTSETDDCPVICKGTSGDQVTLVTNYFRLEIEPGRGVYMYEVRFHPHIDALYLRKKLVNQLSDVLKETRSFDGGLLYLPFELSQKETRFSTKLHDGSDVEINFKLVKTMKMGDKDAVPLFNIIFRRIMSILSMVLHGGRKFTDPLAAQIIPEHKLEVWPGFVTAVEQYEDGIMLKCDSSFRVLQKLTVFELMMDLISSSKDDEWMATLSDMLLNQTVLTRYNNKTYRIDEVIYTGSPMSTFLKKGEPITYYDYYRQHYDIEIKHKDQPLLRAIQKAKVKGKVMAECTDLIPELCYLSGITDTMRNDHKVMKSIIQCSRISPNQRQLALERFLNRIHANPEARQLLSDWGLNLASKNLKLPGRILHPEPVIFGQGVMHGNEDRQCDWTRSATNNPVLSAVNLESWVILCTARDESLAKEFLRMCKQVSSKMGIRISEAYIVKIPNDNTQTFVHELRKLKNNQVQLVFILLPIARNDKYSAIKKVCCIDNPIPSQVAITRTLRNPQKLRSVTQKIVLQMNCKLGGTLWQVKMPLKNTMVIGLDVYHDPTRKSNSVGAVVASMNESMTRWYSTMYRQGVGTELIEGFEMAVTRCLMNYKEVKGSYPQQIVIFRDGLGDGDLEPCSQFEVPQLARGCRKVSEDYNPMFLFVVVQKRITTKLFYEENRGLINPPPGSIMDHTITRRNKFDFFLVSQNVTQGTVTPTHYVVLHNSTKMDAEKIQRLTYKMTHLYYNWCGTIRVPAPCQYAHKLAYLVGEHIHKEADESLSDKLFFL